MFYSVDYSVDENIFDIADALPHGSGIDCKWYASVTSQSIRFSNSFHAMDENGFYDGYADFTVIIPVVDGFLYWDNFKLQFNGKDSQYLNQKHYLREYLEDILDYSLSQYFGN